MVKEIYELIMRFIGGIAGGEPWTYFLLIVVLFLLGVWLHRMRERKEANGEEWLPTNVSLWDIPTDKPVLKILSRILFVLMMLIMLIIGLAWIALAIAFIRLIFSIATLKS